MAAPCTVSASCSRSYDNIEVVLVSPRELCLPESIIDAMRSAGVVVRESHELTGGISDVDIVYSTRIQEERFSSKEEADCIPRQVQA